eukprot:scaffold309796_cov22-Prasinocladus_malaysianus.AAC.1
MSAILCLWHMDAIKDREGLKALAAHCLCRAAGGGFGWGDSGVCGSHCHCILHCTATIKLLSYDDPKERLEAGTIVQLSHVKYVEAEILDVQ